ncbi:hypothetical protein HELRODRAFT_82648, partial [Helobdella robusta]|uniref:Ribosomal protein S6 kinase n=1 Tax=Helobdella robusta TaxID=6412 RepID=T1G4U7_HELRO
QTHTNTHTHITVNLDGKEKVGIKDFEILKVLGEGTYGRVFLVRKITGPDSNKFYAMKVLKKAEIVVKAKNAEHMMTERQVLEHIRRTPFVVTLHYAFQTDEKLHLILDFVNGGDLYSSLNSRGGFNEEQVKVYIAEIAIALESLHKIGVIYRDLKLENVLLGADGHIVLTDFGLSKEFLPADKYHRTYSYCGTVEYMSPELASKCKDGHDYTVDWWSLGVLCFELITGSNPFSNGDLGEDTVNRLITSVEPSVPAFLSRHLASLIRSLLQKNPKFRLGRNGIDDLKAHPFFNNLDWDKLQRKGLPPPFKPKIINDYDVSNFDDSFTNKPLVSPPVHKKACCLRNPADGLKNSSQGYSYVAPSVLFTKNSLSGSFLSLSDDDDDDDDDDGPGDDLNIALAMTFKDSGFFQKYSMDLDGGELGKGSFSICKKCIDKKTKTEYAVKIVSRRVDTRNETAIMRELQSCPFIVQLIDVFQDKLHTYIVMELVSGGELLSKIFHQNYFGEAEAKHVFRQLLSAVQYMHHNNSIVHRDLKPEVYLFTDNHNNYNNNTPNSTSTNNSKTSNASNGLKTPCFTLYYAAPEVLSKGRSYDESCDLWSLGVILVSCCCCCFRCYDNDDDDAALFNIMRRIKAGDYNMKGERWDGISQDAKNIIQGLLTVDPTKRLTIKQLLDHDWLFPYSDPWQVTTSSTASPKIANKREGFKLLAVDGAPLAKKRKRKNKTETELYLKSDGGINSESKSNSNSDSIRSSSSSCNVGTDEIICGRSSCSSGSSRNTSSTISAPSSP